MLLYMTELFVANVFFGSSAKCFKLIFNTGPLATIRYD